MYTNGTQHYEICWDVMLFGQYPSAQSQETPEAKYQGLLLISVGQ